MSGENLKVPQLNVDKQTVATEKTGEMKAVTTPTFLFNTKIANTKEFAINGNEQTFLPKAETQTQSASLFGTNIKTETEKKPQKQEMPTVAPTKQGFLSQIGNYYRQIKYGVNKLDEVIDADALKVLNEHGLSESELSEIYESNPRLQAITQQMQMMAQNYGIQTA